MKTNWMSRLVVVIGLLMAAGPSFANVTGGVDPSYVRVKVYEIRVAESADCSGGITVFRNAAPDYLDMVHNPTLGSGAIPNGTYNCVMMQMSDFIHFTPSTTSGAWSHGVCNVGTDGAADVGHDENAVNPDGSSFPLGAKGTESRVWLYIRTGATINNGGNQNAFVPTGGIPLVSPLVVHGDGTHTMVFDFSGAVGEEMDNGSWACDCDAPTLAFR
jgi:hypothetical protein